VFTTADLAGVTNDGGTILIGGDLNNAGATLSVGPGGALSQITLAGGEIVGGEVSDGGSGLAFQSGVLGGVDYQGSLDLTAANSQVVLLDGTTVSGGAAIGAGSGLEISADSTVGGPIVFTQSTGELKIDGTGTLGAQVQGFGGADVIDFSSVAFLDADQPTFAGDGSGGTLTLSDGTNTASVALFGQYLASSFQAMSDGNGGTLVVDPAAGGVMPHVVPVVFQPQRVFG
jgi:hypothetical protein